MDYYKLLQKLTIDLSHIFVPVIRPTKQLIEIGLIQFSGSRLVLLLSCYPNGRQNLRFYYTSTE